MFWQRGLTGELRASACVVARFDTWQVVRSDDVLGSDVATIETGQVRVLDTFRFSQQPLDLWLDCGRAWWVWRRIVACGESTWRTRGGRPEIRVK